MFHKVHTTLTYSMDYNKIVHLKTDDPKEFWKLLLKKLSVISKFHDHFQSLVVIKTVTMSTNLTY